MKKQIPVVAAFALAIGSSVSAQEAFQWRSEDGGNGHWYRIVVRPYGPYNWNAARADAQATGGDLASFEAPAEWGFMRSRCRELPAGTVTQFLAGGQRQPGAKSPWLWLTGEPFSYFAWNAGVPNDGTGENFVLCVGSGTGGPDDFDGWDDWRINDLSSGYVVEWSADCNNDGIVDYGQCWDGSLLDSNSNNVPDCCESGDPCAPNIILNGGFEIGASQTDCTWVVHSEGDSFVPGWTVIAASIDRVRISASCPPPTESWMSFQGEFTIDLDGFTHGGAMSQMVATEPGSTYLLTFQLTGNCAPGVKRMRVEIGSTQYPFEHACSGTNPQPWSEKSIEFTAAASTTNIVFRSLSTDGRNGAVVDSVRLIRMDPQQPTCRDADFFPDRNINGVDLGVLLSQWGAPTQYTVADLNRDGVVDGVDLGIFLAFWGPCPY
jgi:choice-of-anchor C domain-containing protein